nr:unnamed protein product [Callosobruchus chinensis]
MTTQKVTVEPHSTLNTSRGVIYCKDLLNCSETEIMEELKSEGVIKVQRIKVKNDSALHDTPNHILTFNCPTSPTKIKCAMYRLEVRQYVPPPVRCFKCQRYGHTSMSCQEEQICVCGKKLHVGNPCSQPVQCINCNGPHVATSKICPKYKTEAAIQKIIATEKLSYLKPKERLSSPPPNRTYHMHKLLKGSPMMKS